jgi:hypothetical protein
MWKDNRAGFAARLIEAQTTYFDDENMKVLSKDGPGFFDYQPPFWEPPSSFAAIYELLDEMVLTLSNQEQFLVNDLQKRRPVLEKWFGERIELVLDSK